MKTAELKKMLRKAPERPVPSDLRERLIETIPASLEMETSLKRGRTRRRLTYLAIAAAILLFLWPFGRQQSNSLVASAMADVIKKLEAPGAIYLQLDQRTLANENFEFIAPEAPFIPIRIWIERASDRFKRGRLRVEKPSRRIVFNGASTLFYDIQYNEAQTWNGGGVKEQYRQLADPGQWLKSHLPLTNAEATLDTLATDGPAVVRLTLIEKGTQLEPGSKPAFFFEFDRKTIFSWEKDTHRLIDLERYVKYEDQDVLVAKLKTIDYRNAFDDTTFSQKLPEDVHMKAYSEPNNAQYSKMRPEDVARIMFSAWQNEDWDTVRKFCNSEALIHYMKTAPLAGFEITGSKYRRNPFYPGYHIPYKLIFKDGSVKEHALALRNDNAMKRYVWDGGI